MNHTNNKNSTIKLSTVGGRYCSNEKVNRKGYLEIKLDIDA